MTRPQAEQAQAAKDSVMEYYIYTQIFPETEGEKSAENSEDNEPPQTYPYTRQNTPLNRFK